MAISETFFAWFTAARIAGLICGPVLGAIVQHYAWYKREQDGTAKHVKIRMCLMVFGPTGLLSGLQWAWSAEISAHISGFSQGASISGFGILWILIFSMMISAYLHGRQHDIGITCFWTALFCGWPTVEKKVEEAKNNFWQSKLDVQLQSKLSLLQLAKDATETIAKLQNTKPKRKKNQAAFHADFCAVMSYILFNFFQHSRDRKHPDYCATYYSFNPQKKLLEPVARTAPSFHAAGPSPLSATSFAMLALNAGEPAVWPEDMSKLGIKTLNPPMRPMPGGTSIESFLVVPVPAVENLKISERKGVIIVDTVVKGEKLRDSFHVDLIKWACAMANGLHEQCL